MKQSKREKQTEAPVEEPREQPAPEQAPGDVDPMDFLEESNPEPFPAALQPCEDQSPREFDYPIGGTVSGATPTNVPIIDHTCGLTFTDAQVEVLKHANDGARGDVDVYIQVTDCNAKNLPIEIKEAIADAVRKMPPEQVTQIVQEEAQKVVETLHARHGTKANYVQNPLLPKGATVTPKRMATSGCGHGHANSVLCPQCRANRKP